MTINDNGTKLSSAKPCRSFSEEPLFTLDELIKRRALELGDAPLIGCPNTGLVDFEEHSAISIDKYADAAVVELAKLSLPPVDPSCEPPVIGILAQSGLHIIIQIIALNRLGYASFLISTRLARPAMTQLLAMTGCEAILTTADFHSVLEEAKQQQKLATLPLLSHSDYYKKEAPKFIREYEPKGESKKIAVIIHSSGSTGLPKPIYLTNASCIAAFSTNMGMRALITSPMFHSHGFYETFRSIYSREPIYFCNYSLPLTRETLVQMLDVVKPDLFHCVPYVVKLLAETLEGIRALASVKLVLYGGSGCPEDLGNRLVDNGVYLVGNYGATETGRLMNSTRPPNDKEWNYLRPLPQALQYIFMDKVAPDLYECVALNGLPSKSTTNSNDPPGSFRTRDLFTPHPTRPNLWKYACRLDDRFTLINGEKVLPLPIEGRIRQEGNVKEAIVFGDGKTYPGLLIIKADRANHISDVDFIEQIWPAVEDANTRTESFSRIPKELIVPVQANCSYPSTDKGTFIRAAVYRHFENEIQAAYERYEGQNDDGDRISVEGEELENLLLHQLRGQTGIGRILAETDFFASGVDSLQCIQMWSFIKRKIDLGGRHLELGQNVLYETGNMKRLVRYLEALKSRSDIVVMDELQRMERLINKYSSFNPHVADSSAQPEKEFVLLTGATGALGAHILSQLAAQQSTGGVWVMVRAIDDVTASNRVYSSLESRGIILNEAQKAKIVPLSCDLGKLNLGLTESRLSELHARATIIIHSAWAVNFNIPVQSFEDQHIRAVWNLIQLSLSVITPKPARFFFCSSVSSAGGSPRPGVVAESYVQSPSYAQKTGYAQSKYVAEHITRNAMRKYDAQARVLRIGQLVGDTKLGVWNPMEGVPLMIRTAETIGALPALNEEMTWLPVDHAASVVIELAENGFDGANSQASDSDLVYHVLNPTYFHWSRDMLPALAASGLAFETLSADEWMERFRKADRDPAKNPPIKLLGWFESKYGPKAKSLTTEGGLKYSTDETGKASRSLRRVPDVTAKSYVNMMVQRLKEQWDTRKDKGI